MAGYGDDTAFAAWLVEQGLTLPVGAPSAAVLRQIGSDYVDGAYEHRLGCSHRAGGFAQERAWPREGHTVNRQSVPSNLVPDAWVKASYRAAYLQATADRWATSGEDPNRIAKRERVEGAIDTEYFGPGDKAGGNAAPGFNVDPMIDGSLSIWLCPEDGGGGFAFWAVG